MFPDTDRALAKVTREQNRRLYARLVLAEVSRLLSAALVDRLTDELMSAGEPSVAVALVDVRKAVERARVRIRAEED